MFERPTLFIIGAGCSKEFGLPLGIDLRGQIATLAREIAGPHPGAQADMVSRAWNLNAQSDPAILRPKAQELAAGVMTRPSIDEFLNHHSDDAQMLVLGKLLIASCILSAEAVAANKPLDNVPWLEYVWFQMSSDVGKGRITQAFHNVRFLTFNYDRQIERRLLWYVAHLEGDMNLDQLQALEPNLPVQHVYGKVGALGFELKSPQVIDVGFGETSEPNALFRESQSLRVFSEGVENDRLRATISGELDRAEQIVFAGFSFNKQNVELLKPRMDLGGKDLLFLFYKMSAPDMSWSQGNVMASFSRSKSGVFNMTAADFMRDNCAARARGQAAAVRALNR